MSDLRDNLITELTDEQLSAELHRRRKEKREFQEAEYVKFAQQLIGVLDEFEKITGKRIVKSGYGYRVEEKK